MRSVLLLGDSGSRHPNAGLGHDLCVPQCMLCLGHQIPNMQGRHLDCGPQAWKGWWMSVCSAETQHGHQLARVHTDLSDAAL